MIWILLLILCFGVLLFICAPLYGQPPKGGADDLTDYRAALDQISDETERLHFERRILTSAPAGQGRSKTLDGPPRALTLGVFAFMLLLTPLIYLKLGAPELSSSEAAPALPASVAAAAPDFERLSPEARAEQIQAMVDGLSARLQDTPQDAQGWLRLLRARKVLGQEAVARGEITRMRAALAGEEALIAEIISQSGWDME
jgi:cytochrome c-type biogenesis protein CcmH/NrfG